LATISIAAASTTIAQTAITDTRVPADSSLVYAKPGANAIINGGFDVWQRGTSFTPALSTTGTIAATNNTGNGPYTATVTGMSTTTGFYVGQLISATAGTGNFGSGVATVQTIVSSTSIVVSTTATFTAGTVTNITGFGWTADRWKADTITATTVGQAALATGLGATYGLTLTATNATNSISLSQPLESSTVNPLRGQTVTFSFYASATSAVSLSYAVQGSSTTDVSTSTWTSLTGGSGTASVTTSIQRFTVTVAVPATSATAGLRVNFSTSNITNGAVITLSNVQLEVGSLATQFRRSAGTVQGEIAACMRYFINVNNGNGANNPVGVSWGIGSSSTILNCPTPLPTRMRVLPTIVADNLYANNITGANGTVSYLTTSGGGADFIFIYAVGSVNSGTAYYLGVNSGGRFYYQAELP
jgi:hypothetical protein